MNLVINDFVGDAAFTGFDEALPLKKSFEWKTDRVSYDSGLEQRNQIFERPIRHWSLNWEILDQGARDKVIELFQRARGSFDTFLYTDREDFACAPTECIIVAIADQTNFQLIKTYYFGETEEWDENKKDIVPSGTFPPAIELDGTPQTEGVDYTLDDTTGIVIFGSAPGAGVVFTAQYQFYFRVRFGEDIYTDIQIGPTPIWENGKVVLDEVLS